MRHSRREFLVDVGKGMLVAGLGSTMAIDMGLASTLPWDGPEALTFGPLEPLVSLMQETPVNRLVPLLVERLRAGADVTQLMAAAALANARTFGGEDYVGFHTMMAMAPALRMARDLPEDHRALPVLKVLYRNTNRIQEHGGKTGEVLHPVQPATLPEGRVPGEVLRDIVHGKDRNAAEQTFAAIARKSPADAFNALLYTVQDNTDVHRIVLPYRAWVMVDVVGVEHAHTLLRQSLRYCLNSESRDRNPKYDAPRTVLPKVMDQHRLDGRALGDRVPDDHWVEQSSQALFKASGEEAAGLAGQWLAEGIAPSAIGEVVALAANQLILRDAGRTEREVQPNKPLGSVHGDSIGVHACDSANAWRNMARVSNARNTMACLILAAYQVADDRTNRGGDFQNWQPRPDAEQLAKVKATDQDGLLLEADAAIRVNDQAHAVAVVHRMGELGHPARPVFDLLLRYAISEDGALHAEKFYHTTSDEFAVARAPFRWRQVCALARVTASEYGTPAPGYREACELLGVAAGA